MSAFLTYSIRDLPIPPIVDFFLAGFIIIPIILFMINMTIAPLIISAMAKDLRFPYEILSHIKLKNRLFNVMFPFLILLISIYFLWRDLWDTMLNSSFTIPVGIYTVSGNTSPLVIGLLISVLFIYYSSFIPPIGRKSSLILARLSFRAVLDGLMMDKSNLMKRIVMFQDGVNYYNEYLKRKLHLRFKQDLNFLLPIVLKYNKDQLEKDLNKALTYLNEDIESVKAFSKLIGK